MGSSVEVRRRFEVWVDSMRSVVGGEEDVSAGKVLEIVGKQVRTGTKRESVLEAELVSVGLAKEELKMRLAEFKASSDSLG